MRWRSHRTPKQRALCKGEGARNPRGLEGEVEGHLDLAGAAYGFVDYAEAAEGWRGIERLAVDGKVVEEEVLRDVVDGDVEAVGVGEVEDVEGKAGVDAFGDFC